MKKILIASNVITLCMLLIAFKKPDNYQPETLSNPPNSFIKLGINPELAKQMGANYRDSVWQGRKIKKQKQLDARSVWFSLAKLKAFITDVENKVNAAYNKGGKQPVCTLDQFDLGVRIYFCNYPEDKKLWTDYAFDNYFGNHDIPEEYAGLHTLMMVPTIYKQDEQLNYDFDPRYFSLSTDGKCIPQPKSFEEIYTILTGANANRVPLSETVPANQFYSFLPDNLDSRRFIDIKSIAGKKKNLPGSANKTTSANDIDFTNGGTLIPPPYPDIASPTGNGLYKKKVLPGDGRDAVQLGGVYNIPCSGASFMRFIDGVQQKCGNYAIPKTPAQ